MGKSLKQLQTNIWTSLYYLIWSTLLGNIHSQLCIFCCWSIIWSRSQNRDTCGPLSALLFWWRGVKRVKHSRRQLPYPLWQQWEESCLIKWHLTIRFIIDLTSMSWQQLPLWDSGTIKKINLPAQGVDCFMNVWETEAVAEGHNLLKLETS